MKRSGSKLIARAGSVKNISKSGYRFSFELVLQSCDSVLGNSEVVCTWQRGSKVVATEPFRIQKAKRLVAFDGATLQQEITLFKKKKSDAQFQPKVYQIALRQGSAEGRIVGKIGIDLAGYAQLPSSSKRISAQLSSGSHLILAVKCRYIGEVAKKRNAQNTELMSTASDESASTSFSDLTLDDSVHSLSSPSSSPKPGSNNGCESGGAGIPALNMSETGKEKEEIRRLTEENRELRRDVTELQDRFAREPEYADVVAQLREAKVALAILSLERDELHQRLHKRNRGR